MLGYVSLVLVMYSLSGLVLYRTRPDKEYITNTPIHMLLHNYVQHENCYLQ